MKLLNLIYLIIQNSELYDFLVHFKNIHFLKKMSKNLTIRVNKKIFLQKYFKYHEAI